MKRYPNPKLMLFVLLLAVGLLVVAFGRLPKVRAEAPTPVCTMNPVVFFGVDSGAGTLRQAVADACPGSTITFNYTGTISLSNQITIDKNLTIQGPGTGQLSVRNNAPRYTTNLDLFSVITPVREEEMRKISENYKETNRIFYVNEGVTAAINGLTVKDAQVRGDGGGIYNRGTLTVTGVTITNNRMIGDGGGICNFGDLTVINSTISNNGWINGLSNNSNKGGGIANHGTLTVTGSTISDNLSHPCFYELLSPPCGFNDVASGGIFNGGMATVTGSVISGNQADNYHDAPGAGAIANYGTLNVSDTVFDGNRGTTRGIVGGIYNQVLCTANITNSTFKNGEGLQGPGGISSRGIVSVTSTTFSNNQGKYSIGLEAGGAILVEHGTFTLTNSTVSNNRALGVANIGANGGGIAVGGTVGDGTLNIINSTITNNTTSSVLVPLNLGSGGGIWISSGLGTVNVRNSIIAGNTARPQGGPDFKGKLNSQGYNIIGNPNSTTITGDTTGNIVGTDARLAPLRFYGGKTQTHALLPGSPAINAGDTANAPATDQRGAPRVGAADIGAFELNDSSNGGSFVEQLPDGMIQTPYNFQLVPDRGAFTYSLTGGALPSGISLSTNGVMVSIEGTTQQSGHFNFSVTATDGTDSYVIEYGLNMAAPNTPPAMTAATNLSRQQGSSATNSQIATVIDDSGDANVGVTVTSANPSNGVTLSNIVNTNGTITADIIAACGASNASFTLQASDGASTTTATLNVIVTPNIAPTLTYGNQVTALNGALTINPATGPTDNGSISTIAVQSAGTYGGPINLNTTTGAVSISNAAPAGTHTITIRATDNCGLFTDASFTLNVSKGDQTITFGPLSGKTYGDAPFTVGASGGASGNPVNFSSQTPTVCTVGGATLTIVSAGTCTIRASQAGNSNYNAASDVDRSFTVNKSTASVTLSNLTQTYDGTAKSATASTNPAGKTVDIAYSQGGSAVASPTNVGSYDVSAAINDSNYQGSTTGTLIIGKVNQTITFGALSAKTYGDAPFTISATGGASGNAVTFSSQTTSVCTVGGNTVTIVSAGTCTVRASQTGNTNYNAAPDVDRSFTVNKATPTISWNNPADITYGTALSGTQLNATASVAGSFGYTPPAATVLPGGANQTLSVNFTPANTTNYSSASKNVSINVLKANQTMSFNPLSGKTYGDAPFAVGASGGASGNPVNFSSQTPTVCTVGGATVTIVSAGTCTVRASQSGNSNYNAAPDVDRSFTINKASATVTLSNLSQSYDGTAKSATATTNPAGKTVVVTYSQSGSAVASPTTVGSYNVSATINDTNYEGSTTGTLVIGKANQTITFGALSNKTYGSADFGVGATSDSGLAVSLAATGNCTVTSPSPGTAQLTGVGSCTITASQAGNSNYNAASPVGQSFNIAKANQTITFAALGNKTFGDPDFAVSGTASSSLPVSFAASGNCTVVENTVHLTGAGACTITASQTGNSNYNAATLVPQTFTISKANQTITFAALTDKTFGDADFTLGATTSSGLSVIFAATGNCTALGSTVHLTGAGSCTITASQAGDTNYNAAASVERSFTIGKANQTIAFAAFGNKTVGDADFNLSATATSGLSVSFTAAGQCTVLSSTVHLTGSGSCTITAKQSGDANFNPAADVPQTFNITEVNQAPTAVNDTLGNIAEDSGQRTIPASTLTTNDSTGPSYESGQTLSVKTVSNPVGGTVSILGGNVVFTPTADYNGPASFDYTVEDNGTTNGIPAPLVSGTATVSFKITEVNDVPVANNTPLGTVAENSGEKVIQFSTLLSNDSRGPANESGQSLTVKSVSNPVGGTVSIVGNTVRFMLTANFHGEAFFKYTIEDNGTTNGVPDPKTSAPGTAFFNVTAAGQEPTPAVIRFSAANYSVAEGGGSRTITVERTGDTTPAVTVDYASSDHSNPADFLPCTSPGAGLASSRCDFTTAIGTLRFAVGETSKTFNVLISQDNDVEGPETLTLTLSNPTGGAVFGEPSTAILEITDDVTEPITNPVDVSSDYVRSLYHDMLNREPDAPGLAFWTDNIEKCRDAARRPPGQTVAECIDKQRESTAVAFFSSPEFHMTGGFVYRLYKGSLTGSPNFDGGSPNSSPGRFPTFLEFMRDVSQVSEGIVVNNQISGAMVEANRNRLAAEFVERPEFVAKYGGLNNMLYVEELFNTTGINQEQFNSGPGSSVGGSSMAAEKQALVDGLTNGTETRASVLRKVVDGTVVISEGNVQFTSPYGQAFYEQELNRVFVYMEYVGYLRRNPDPAGFVHWLGKLNQYHGDPFQAEMVRSFILAPEYRNRFGQ